MNKITVTHGSSAVVCVPQEHENIPCPKKKKYHKVFPLKEKTWFRVRLLVHHLL